MVLYLRGGGGRRAAWNGLVVRASTEVLVLGLLESLGRAGLLIFYRRVPCVLGNVLFFVL